MRQRVLDEYGSRNIRVVTVYQHGRLTPVSEDGFKKARRR